MAVLLLFPPRVLTVWEREAAGAGGGAAAIFLNAEIFVPFFVFSPQHLTFFFSFVKSKQTLFRGIRGALAPNFILFFCLSLSLLR